MIYEIKKSMCTFSIIFERDELRDSELKDRSENYPE